MPHRRRLCVSRLRNAVTSTAAVFINTTVLVPVELSSFYAGQIISSDCLPFPFLSDQVEVLGPEKELCFPYGTSLQLQDLAVL